MKKSIDVKLDMDDALGVTNGYIYETLVNQIKVSALFQDVYASDSVDVSKLKKLSEFIFITNLSKSDAVGTHFVCVVRKENKIIYLDSFGLPASTSPALYARLRRLGKPIHEFYNYSIQHPSSAFCGMFAIYFALMYDYRRMPNTSGMKRFSRTRLRNNEKTLMKNIVRLLNQNTHTE